MESPTSTRGDAARGADAPRGGPSDRDALHDALFREVEAFSGVGAWTWDPLSGLSSWSEQMYRILGLDPSTTRLSPELYLEMVPAEQRDNVMRKVRTGIRDGKGYAVDHTIVCSDGSVREVHTRGRGVVDADGVLTQALGTVQDVTEPRSVARELARARDLFAGVLEAATEQSIIGLDPAGIITVFNAGAERMLGWSAAEMVGRTDPPWFYDRAEVDARAAELGVGTALEAVLGSAVAGEPETRQWTYLAKDGRQLQVMVTTTAMRDNDGAITGFIEVGTDITARVDAELALLASESLFEEIFDNAPSGILLVDTTDPERVRTVRVNPAMCRITGYSVQQLLQMTLGQLAHPDIRTASDDPTDGRLSGREAEWRWLRADGRDIWVQVNASPVHHENSHFVVAMVEDVTARREAEDRLSHLALHDALTGLPNRLLMLDRLEHALASAGRSHTKVAVLYLDLDGFKAVNDEAGHLAGDDVLRIVAKRLRDHLRPGDTVARIGGDEFVVVGPGFADDMDAQSLAHRLLDVLAEPYPRGAGVHHLSASIGVAVSTEDSTAQSLLQEADDAMYVAKDDGKNRVYRSGTFDAQSLSRTAKAARYLQVEAELRKALDRDELVMFGQPVMNLASGAVVAIETLIRWQHPTQGLLFPASFLDVAETSHLMTQLGRRVLDESCRIVAGLAGDGVRGVAEPVVYVNISGRQLESGTLREDVLHALQTSGLAADRLVLELTETFTPLIAGTLLEDLDDLRRRGVRLAIDDVGTGYSSLSRLTELPVDILKIDRSFIGRMGRNPAADAVVKAILSIGRSLGVQVVAEGVETTEEAATLATLGCTTVQGFLYSRALPADALPGLLI